MIFLLPLLAATGLAAPQLEGLLGDSPQVTLDYATFEGTTAIPGVDSFLGMPFAVAGRYENPRVLGAQDKSSYSGVQDATKYGPACPQQELIASPLSNQNAEVGAILGAVEELAFVQTGLAQQSEDCLSVNVQIPRGLNSSQISKLPVIFWIHGGGFELGSSAALGSETTALPGIIYQGANIVTRSVEMGQPIIFVSANHRLNAFGGLASQEITDAGVSNLHLKDQREAMRWIQKYISSFGGDPSKVTLFGESAGSMSIATHLVLNDGDNEGLFRGAIMASGGILKVKDYHQEQGTFDFMACCTGCDAGDKLACLRTVAFSRLYDCLQEIPNFFSYDSTKVPWYPRPDGKFLTKSPSTLIREGKVADVPFIIGDMKDEGTLFSVVPQLNITNDADFQAFWKLLFFQDLSDEQIQAFTDLYSQDPAEGSPFDTGDLNAIGPQYKRLAAAVGDYTFQMGRRDLLNYTYALRGASQKTYTYLQEQSLYGIGALPLPSPLNAITGFPVLGSFHVSDVTLNSFGTIPPAVSTNTKDLMSTYIAFVNSLDPNDHGLQGLPTWPIWDPEGKGMFKFQEKGPVIIKDDYREEAFDFVNERADNYSF